MAAPAGGLSQAKILNSSVRKNLPKVMPLLASYRKRLADLIPELAKFCVVGLTGAIIDLGGADYLHVHLGIGPLAAKGLSITAATIVTYLGSRFWTFRHRVNQPLLREGMLFVVLNIIGLAIAEGGDRDHDLRAGHEVRAGLQRGQRGRDRAGDYLPVLRLQEVGLPG